MIQDESLQERLRDVISLASNEGLCSTEELEMIRAIGSENDSLALDPQDQVEQPQSQTATAPQIEDSEVDKDGDVRQRIAKMSIPQKIKLALFGNSVCRLLLMRDANRIVQLTVLKNPQISLREIEEFARNSNSPDYVLRTISDNQAWIRGYSVKLALVGNPKTPQDLSMKWLRFMNQNDLKRLAKSKSVPQLIAVTAKKRLADMQV